ncbi:MAG: peptidase [Bryobacterales bacterium]|nr:peptidase [Bryobacterales bacterium]
MKNKAAEASEKPAELELLAASIQPITRLAAEDAPDDEELVAEVAFYTGAAVQRRDFWTGEKYLLTFSMEPEHCDLSMLNSGAPLLGNHSSYDLASVLGVVENGRIENGVGKASVRFSGRDDIAGVRADVKNKILRKVSMGAAIRKLRDITAPDGEMKSFLAVDWCPMEISIVPIPADAGAGFLSHQSVEPQIERATAHEEKTVKLNEQTAPGADEQARLDAVRTETLAAERARVSAIQLACAPFSALTPAFRQNLVDSGVTVEAANAAILNKMAEITQADPTRSAHSLNVTRDQDETLRAQVENALLHRWDPVKFKLEAGREYQGMALLEIVRELATLKGIPVKGMPKHRLVELAFQGTTDFANILANVANKSLRSGYDAEPQTFLPLTKRGTAADFKTISRTQIGDVPTLTKVNASGEFDYTKATDAKETYALGTYGKIFAINRQTLIDDDLGAFTRIPESMGRAGRRMESDIVWGVVTANAAMADSIALFHASHANLTGSGTAISVASLGVGVSAMRLQTGLGGIGVLNLEPKHLVVPVALTAIAKQYVAATTIVYTKGSDFNPYNGTMDVISEPRLDAASATAWYLFADPSQIDTVEYCYLEGQEGVYLETRMGFEVDGMELKAREDFAAKALDWRGMYKNVGV